MEQILESIKVLSDDSRVWIYQTAKAISDEELEILGSELISSFTSQWTSHNRHLQARGYLIHGRFVVIFLDESASSEASGCSIDKLVHFVTVLGSRLGVDFMDRTTFHFATNNGIAGIHMNDLTSAVQSGQIDLQDRVYDSLVKTKKEWAEEWLKPLKDSWHSRFV